MNNSVQWLHLSDLHFGYEDNSVNQLRNELPNYLKDYFKNKKVDYIFITGDVIYGKSDADKAYQQALLFIEKVRDAIRIEKEKIYIVPGNHDYKRQPVRSPIIQDLQNKYSVEVGDIDDNYIETLEASQRQFACFYEQACGRKFNTKHFLISDKVNILSLNSTITSYSSSVDIGNLILGINLVDKVLQNIDHKKPLFILSHHSFEWFRRDEREKLEMHLKRKNAALFLCGHIHKSRYNLVATMNQSKYLYECLCATNMDKDENGHQSDMGFFTGNYDIVKNKGVVTNHKWDRDHEEFVVGKEQAVYTNPLEISSGDVITDNKTLEFDLLQVPQDKAIIKEVSKVARILKYSNYNKRAWFDRKDIYYNLDREFCENNCDILFVNGLEEDENPLTVYYWLKSKNFNKDNILYFKIAEDETGDILFELWKDYYNKNKLYGSARVYLLIEGLNKNNENVFLRTLSDITQLYSNVKIAVFSEIPCEGISDMRRYNNIECLSFGALNEENIVDFFNLYKKNVNKNEIKSLKKTGYSITILKKCIKYIDNGLSINEAIELCMRSDYVDLIEGTNVKELNQEESILAAALSLFNTPFSKKIAWTFQSNYCKSEHVLNDLLTKGILINNSRYSLCIAPIYIRYLRDKSNIEFKEKVYRSIAKYYYSTYICGMRNKGSKSNIIMCGIYACKYLQKAGEYGLANDILHKKPAILRSAQKIGFYLELIDILKKQYENGYQKDFWNIYDYAHCLIIAGKYSLARRILNKVELSDISDYDCKMGILRLKCEVMNQYNDTAEVLDFLIKNYELYTNHEVNNAMNNQINMFMVRLYMQNMEFEKVQNVCNSVINVSLVKPSDYRYERSRQYNLAVAKTYVVQKKILCDENIDRHEVIEVKDMFKNLNDKRGYSWILGLEGESLLKDNLEEAYKCIKESIKNRREMNEKSQEYSIWLDNIKKSVLDQEIISLIDKEQNRIQSYY